MTRAGAPARDLDSGSGTGAGAGRAGGKGSSTVPGRIGRPPQWTGTRSRKLARLYMYTTLSVDKILKVLEDDVFKPRKNSAQKTIHNMLDHDPRYLRPESREDMNQRLKLLAASSQRSRRSWKKRDAPPPPHAQHAQHAHAHQLQHPQHPQHAHQQPHPQHQGYDTMMHGIKPEIGGHSAGMPHMAHPQQPQHHLQHPQHAQPHAQPPHAQHLQHPQQQQQQQHHLQHAQHAQHPEHHPAQHAQHQLAQQQYAGQPSPSFLPPPQNLHQQHPQHQQTPSQAQQHPQQQQQQPYHDFYHSQYQQPPPAPQQHPQQHPLSMQQMNHGMQPFMGSGWGGVYDNQAHADPSSRLAINSASFDMAPHAAGMAPIHQQHQQQHHHQQQPQHQQHQQHAQAQQHAVHGHHAPPHHQPPPPQQHHYHATGEHGGLDAHGHYGADSGITSSHLPLYGDSQHQRRMSSAAYSDDSNASSDVSTETIQDLKQRLSGCSTHYANQVANLLRRFTISSGSDDPSPAASVVLSGTDNNADPHRIRKLWRQRKPHVRSGSISSASSSGSFGEHDSDVDVYGDPDDDNTGNNNTGGTSGATSALRRGQSSHGGSNPSSVAGGGSPDARDDEGRAIAKPAARQATAPSASGSAFPGKATPQTTILGVSGDNMGSARLALPGDFFNAYQYRNDENCPYHNKEQLIKDEQLAADEERSFDRNGRGAYGGSSSRRGGVGASKGLREKRCWCAIAETVGTAAIEDGSFWVLADGRLTPDAQAMMHESTQQRHQLGRRDRFGHSILHLLAAREGFQMQLLGMVLNCDDATLVAVNTAGQTFLHLLAPGWFVGLHEPYAPLLQLLAHLRSRMRAPPGGPDIVDGKHDGGNAVAHLIYAIDVYGRSFFHRFGTYIEDLSILTNVLVQHYDRAALSRRDALSHVPLALLGSGQTGGGGNSGAPDGYAGWRTTSPNDPHQQRQLPSLQVSGSHGSSTLSPYVDEFAAGATTSPAPTATPAIGGGNVPMVFASEDAFIRHHESLLRTVTASDSQPGVEDPEGRNGLHCLAEAIVDKRMMDEYRNALSSGRKPPKKKTLDKRESISVAGADGGAPGAGNSFMSGLLLGGEGGSSVAPSDASAGGGGYSSTTSPYMTGNTSLSTTPTTTSSALTSSARTLLHTSADGAQMATRLRLVQGLLSPPTVVDVNHYDRRGQTVLTAFVVHIPDHQEDKAKSLVAILETLLAAGARLEGRNRRGETPLLVAARLGRKIALTTLLDHGANVHARDAAGRGVLDVLDMQCRRHARRDVALYGRLEACRVLLTSIKQLPLGVKQRPTLLDEWTIVHRRGPEPRDMAMSM